MLLQWADLDFGDVSVHLAQELFILSRSGYLSAFLAYTVPKIVLIARREQVHRPLFLAQFDLTFQYRPGKENVVADALSRKTINSPTVRAREVEDRTMRRCLAGWIEKFGDI